MIDQDHIKDLLARLDGLIGASCTCVTKTPDIKHHQHDCRYRVIVEAQQTINTLNAELLQESARVDAMETTHDHANIRVGDEVIKGQHVWCVASHFENLRETLDIFRGAKTPGKTN